MSIVLDASALLVFILGEPGADRVRAAIPEGAMTTVNLAEVVGYFARKGLAEVEIRDLLDELPVEWIAFDGELAYAAGLLIPKTRSAGLSLGDRACLALARRLGVEALTADHAWTNVSEAVGIKVELIR